MSAPVPPGSRDTSRERLIALLVLGVALVLLVSSVTWFGTGQTVVGVGQLALGGVLAVVGAVLFRRAQRGGPPGQLVPLRALSATTAPAASRMRTVPPLDVELSTGVGTEPAPAPAVSGNWTSC